MNSFLDKLIDWKDFEKFVALLYKESDELEVEHNVTEVGKSGAKRQIDVKVTQKTKLHTIKTIIECKRWKEKVDRQVIDVLFASVEDLNANKGAIFTTKGYEEGAIQYAKSKNIDIFIVRDIYEDEWGKPGRFILLYLQFFQSKMDSFIFENSRFLALAGQPPTTAFSFVVQFAKEQYYPEQLNLYSLSKPEKGPNFIKILIDIKNYILKQWTHQIKYLLQPESEKPQQAFEIFVKLNFKNYPFKFFKHEDGYIAFDSIGFTHHISITQEKMELDRAASSDFALIVENFITNQRNYASKRKDEDQVKLSAPIEITNTPEKDVVKNGSVLKITLEHYIDYVLHPNTQIIKLPEMTVNLQYDLTKKDDLSNAATTDKPGSS